MPSWIELYTPGESAVALLARGYRDQALVSQTAAAASATAAGTSATAADAARTAAESAASAVAGGTVPNPLRAPDGSASLPSYSFTSEVGAGFYRVGAAVLGFASLGSLSFAIGGVAGATNYPHVFPAVTGQPVQLRAFGADANIPLVLGPKGSGALIAQFPDSTAAGGNARGANATDWQTTRGAATQVASGANSAMGGGSSNTASGTNSTIGGGLANLANNLNCTIAGGTSNTASGNHSFVGGGTTNISSNTATVVAGGNSNTANAANASVLGGTSNSASAANASVGGGTNNAANGVASWIPGGAFATTRGVIGRGAWAATRIAATGDAQCGEHHLLRQTTDATATRLTSDNAAAGTTNQIILPNFSAYAEEVLIVSKAAGSTASACWRVLLLAARGANAASTVLSAASTLTSAVPTDSIGVGSAWRLTVSADTTNGGIAIDVTGAAATTVNHSGRASGVEATTTS